MHRATLDYKPSPLGREQDEGRVRAALFRGESLSPRPSLGLSTRYPINCMLVSALQLFAQNNLRWRILLRL